MSVTIEDKIELFSKLIFGNIEKESSEKRRILEEVNKEELEKLKQEVERRKKEIIDAAATNAQKDIAKLTAQAHNQQQHIVVAQKQKAMQRAMEKLKELAVAFTNTKEYEAYLKNNIDSALKSLSGSKQVAFYVLEKDLLLCEDILSRRNGSGVNFEVKKAAGNLIGGIIAEDKENLLQLDLSLKSVIDEAKDSLGAAITRRYNEVNEHAIYQ